MSKRDLRAVLSQASVTVSISERSLSSRSLFIGVNRSARPSEDAGIKIHYIVGLLKSSDLKILLDLVCIAS